MNRAILSRWLLGADAMLQRAGAWRIALLVGIAALALRLARLAVHPAVPDGDERTYMALAGSLARHGRFSVDALGPLEDHFGPLYPLLQAAIILLGASSLHAGLAVSLLAGSLAPPLVYLLALRQWKQPAAAAAAGLAAVVHPGMIGASRMIYTEALTSALLLLAVLSVFSRRRPGFLCGFALGLAALTRRESAFLVPFFMAALWANRTEPGPPPRWREPLRLLLIFLLVFAPYLVYLRLASGHWTMSAKANYAWIVGRLMEERPDEEITVQRIHDLEKQYPTPLHWFLDRPLQTFKGLVQSALLHLGLVFFGAGAWPIGIVALLGLARALLHRSMKLWPPSPLLIPFVLVLFWALAGPTLRYSRALGPFVCGLVAGLPARNGRADEGLKTSP
ncbi:MAG TPA: glycosyltransferase family 39 protein [Candidatus Polarisedimenticolia bacterium]|nr:glycosyltransferase family 39 protein [Candidatus Polarisedimenticolia bacterium]